MTTTYLTVAIPYVNAPPHLGYGYELVAADIAARARRAAGKEVRFLGGTDDYSLKNVLAAEAAGISTAAFVRAHGDRFEQLAVPLELSLDDFIRTSSDPRHAPAVERLWRACAANGDLYRRAYEGTYCVGCEQFYTAAELVEGCCPEHKVPLEHVREENWFFRLSAYRDRIEELITSGALVVTPASFKEEVLAFVRRGLEDISISRSVARARGWGLGVPDDPAQVIYVWFDALTNYLSALDFGETDSAAYQRWWRSADERIHVIGKGILRFHAVYWPAFLLSAGEPPPTRIQVHPYLTVDGAKLSKSAGDAPDPALIAATYGVDALRWWFARDVAATADTDFTTARLVARANEDLANGLGNVVSRIAHLVHRSPNGCLPELEAAVPREVGELVTKAGDAFIAFDHRLGARLVVEAVGIVNRDLDRTKPWLLARDASPAAQQQLGLLLATLVKSAQAIAVAVGPVLPTLSRRLLDQLDASGQVTTPVPAYARIAAP
jgi:methionyl-tRNA synthetase